MCIFSTLHSAGRAQSPRGQEVTATSPTAWAAPPAVSAGSHSGDRGDGSPLEKLKNGYLFSHDSTYMYLDCACYTQSSPFYPLSTLNVTHVRKDTPFLGGPGDEAT